MATFARCLLGGAGFGLAMAAVEVWTSAVRLVSLGMGSPLPMVTSGAAMIVALAALVGVATIAAARRGRVWHWIAMAILWIAIQEYAAPAGRVARTSVLLMPVGGLVLTVVGGWIGRRARWAPAALGLAAVVSGILAPEVAARLRVRPTAAPLVTVPPAPPGAPDVLLIALDAARADHLGAYGYTRPTSPNFDALARDGALFLDAVSPGTWSLPSHASLFTGRFVSVHGAHDEHMSLEPRTPALAERFSAAGYETRSFTADPRIADSLGMTRGIGWTDGAWRNGDVARSHHSMYRLLDRLGLGATDKGGAQVTRNVEQWLADRPVAAHPAFTFVDFVDARVPYHELPADYLGRFTPRPRRELRGISMQLAVAQSGGTLAADADAIDQATAMYDAGMSYVDMLLGRIVEALRRRGSLDRTIIVVLSDHGEQLGDHGVLGHGRSMYESVLRVPLLVRYPATVAAGRRIDTPVSTVGVYATLLDLAGLSPEPNVQVGSLTAVLRGEPHPGPIIAEQFSSTFGGSIDPDDPLLQSKARFRVYRAGRRKLVDAAPGGTFLFNLDDDPGEEHDVAMKERLTVGRLREELDEWRERLGIPDLNAPAE